MKNKNCPICDGSRLSIRPDKLRDRDDIGLLECDNCAHVFLDTFEHIDNAYFDRGKFLLDKPFIHSVEDRLRHYAHETDERAERIGELIVNKRVLDFGCGAGALMSRLSGLAKSIEGVEPTEPFRIWLQDQGMTVHKDLSDAKGPYDIIAMFHVLEHLPNPVVSLREIADCLAPGGMIYLEVPNVNDALLTLYQVEAAQRFLFFGDHLQYFSRSSLGEAISRAGLKADGVWGHNRFSLANHLFWLARGKPGGHKSWSFLETPSLAREYARALAAADISDSLTAQVRLGGEAEV